MATWNAYGNQVDFNSPAPFLGQVTTEIEDIGQATEIAKRLYGDDVSYVARASHLGRDSFGRLITILD